MTLCEALSVLHASRRIRAVWLPGLRYTPGGGGTSEPDLDDPATVGCLAALCREATGDPWARAEPGMIRNRFDLPAGDGWQVIVFSVVHRCVDSEGEAWAVALIATAEAL